MIEEIVIRSSFVACIILSDGCIVMVLFLRLFVGSAMLVVEYSYFWSINFNYKKKG